jgi:hypothetical protein
MRRLLLLLLVAIAVFSGFIPRELVYAKTYHGQVLDKETGKPLEGAVVVVVWHTRPIIAMDAPEYFHDAKEALTDAQGRFRMEASPAIDWNPFTVIKKPNIVIFQPGYEPFALLRTLTRQGFTSFEDVDRAFQRGDDKTAEIKDPRTESKVCRCIGYGHWGDLPFEKVPNLVRLLNVQRKMVGFTSFY